MKKVSPIGSKASDATLGRARRSQAYRQKQADLAPFQKIAWLLIKYRMQRGLSQRELADRVGTSFTQISRIESGRHKPNFETLLRIARALDLKMLVGFEQEADGKRPKRDLVSI